MPRRTLSSLHPALYSLAVKRQQWARSFGWHFGKKKYAVTRGGTSLPERVTTHQSLLIRMLVNVDIRLQYNKVHNLNLAIRADRKMEAAYSITEKNHRYLTDSKQNYRANEIWRQTRNRETGTVTDESLLYKNEAVMKYSPPYRSHHPPKTHP